LIPLDSPLHETRYVSLAIALASMGLAAFLSIRLPRFPWRDEDDLPPPTACVTSPRRPRPGTDGAALELVPAWPTRDQDRWVPEEGAELEPGYCSPIGRRFRPEVLPV
jgi:hypothetical protein